MSFFFQEDYQKLMAEHHNNFADIVTGSVGPPE